MVRNHPKCEFWTKSRGLDAFWPKNSTIVWSTKLVPKQHPRTRFRQAALAATKWCETTQNMSFGPNVVDWKRFGRKSRKKFHWPELVPKRHPRIRFRNGTLAATKWCESIQNMSFRPKVVD